VYFSAKVYVLQVAKYIMAWKAKFSLEEAVKDS